MASASCEVADKVCLHHGLCLHVMSSEGRLRCKQCRVVASRKRRNVVKNKLVVLLGGACSKCGYDRCVEALDFHHIDPSEKAFGLANKFHWAWKRLTVEAKKCKLLCANCHREEHANR